MRFHVKLSVFVAACTTSCCLLAEPVERMPAKGETLTAQEIAFVESVADDEIHPVLYGGRPAEDGELPMSLNVGFCSVAVVGPKVFHSASHCHATGSKASFMYKGVKYTGTCTRHPEYDDRTVQNDWSLCLLDKEVDLPYYASLKVSETEVGSVVVLSGYGRGSENGKLHLAKLPIARIQGQEIITQDRKTFLGAGDSGNFLILDTDLKKGPFNIVGVNSRAGSGMSIFNMTGHENAQKFYKDYADKNNVKICGINWDCAGKGEEPPPPPPEIPGFCSIEKKLYEVALAKVQFFNKKLMDCAK